MLDLWPGDHIQPDITDSSEVCPQAMFSPATEKPSFSTLLMEECRMRLLLAIHSAWAWAYAMSLSFLAKGFWPKTPFDRRSLCRSMRRSIDTAAGSMGAEEPAKHQSPKTEKDR
jgi:hypothetical protein